MESFRLLGGLTMAGIILGTAGTSTCDGREWIEGENNGILMVSGGSVYRSEDAGLSWQWIVSPNNPDSSHYFTRLSDGSLLLTTGWGWVRSTDDGQSWSDVTSFNLTGENLYMYGPVIECAAGRTAPIPSEEKTSSTPC